MQANDIYSITLHQKMNTTVIVNNVFFYRQVNTGLATALDLAQAFTVKLKNALLAAQTTNVEWVKVVCYNLFNTQDFATVFPSNPVNGNVIGDSLPPFCAVRLFAKSKVRRMRDGQKFFAGISENFAANGIILGELLSSFNAVAGLLSDPLTGGGITANVLPVVVKRIKYLDPDDNKIKYRLPINVAETQTYTADNWVLSNKVAPRGSRRL